MLFKRRKRQSLWSRVRNLIWPKMGWARTFNYIKHRVLRLPSSASSIALGLASGCVVSWTPTFGFHILQCFVFCLLVRANFLAALLGTTFGNPWTFPILLWCSYQVGSYVLMFLGYGDLLLFDPDMHLIEKFKEYPVEIFMPMLVGGYTLVFITFPLFYFPFYYMVKAGRAAQVKVSAKVHDIIDHRKEKYKK